MNDGCTTVIVCVMIRLSGCVQSLCCFLFILVSCNCWGMVDAVSYVLLVVYVAVYVCLYGMRRLNAFHLSVNHSSYSPFEFHIQPISDLFCKQNHKQTNKQTAGLVVRNTGTKFLTHRTVTVLLTVLISSA